ncbi:MAG: adaptor protein MecA [Clostridia bacterium]|nr:adaptor protein MecA [Clostridia bacterium]
MDYLRIDENKLKITMTEEELLFYGMDLATLSYSSTETRRAFWAILDDAKHATGFDAAATRVSVQIYASRAGGCEMYVIGTPAVDPRTSEITAIGDTDTVYDADLLGADQIGERSGLTVCPSIARRFRRAMGEFRKLSDLLSACLALSSCGYDGDSSAWQMGDRYYLSLAGNHGAATGEPDLSATGVISEFGNTVKDLSLTYLAEHGQCLCKKHAVEQLALMAT